MMRPRSKFVVALLILSLTIFLTGWPGTAKAVPTLWTGNNNYYDLIITNGGSVDTGLTWQSAVTAAAGLTFMGVSGHLATITSAGENSFIDTTFNRSPSVPEFAWIGGHEPADDGVWKWAVGPEVGTQFSNFATQTAPFNYANWGGIEPNDHVANEDFAMFNIGIAWPTTPPANTVFAGEWADAAPTPSSADPVIGYIVEYEIPVPEPATFLLLGTGLAGLGLVRRRKKG